MSKENKENKETRPENNLQFVGRQARWNAEENKLVEVAREAPAFIIDGREKIKLPDSAEQKKGFHLDEEKRAQVQSLFGDDFKTPIVK